MQYDMVSIVAPTFNSMRTFDLFFGRLPGRTIRMNIWKLFLPMAVQRTVR